MKTAEFTGFIPDAIQRGIQSPQLQRVLFEYNPHRVRQAKEQIRDDLTFLRDEYGLDVRMGRLSHSDEDDLDLTKLSLQEAVPALRTVREELAKYPAEFIRFCQLTKVRLVKSLFVSDKDTPSGFNEVGGLAYSDSGYIYIPLNDDLLLFRKTIHHELFHSSDHVAILENTLSSAGDRKDIIRQIKFFNRSWAYINPNGEYIYKDDSYRLRKGQTHNDPVKGFACRYGMKDEYEDRATIAEYLMTDPDYLFRRFPTDTVLRRKTRKVMKYFRERSSGQMDETYFRELSLRNAPSYY